jgi:hypothetical protein
LKDVKSQNVLRCSSIDRHEKNSSRTKANVDGQADEQNKNRLKKEKKN